MQHATAGMTPGVAGAPSEAFQSAGHTMYTTQAGLPAGVGATSMYQHSSMPSPMGGPVTDGSSASGHIPASARASALDPSAQSFAIASHPLHSQQLPSQQLASHGFGALTSSPSYPYGQPQYGQHQQGFQSSPPTTMPHLNQPLSAPHPQRPPDNDDPYGQQWQSQYGA